MEDKQKLSRSLKSRHIQMIAIGGASGPVYSWDPGVPFEQLVPQSSSHISLLGSLLLLMRAIGSYSSPTPVSRPSSIL